MMEDGVLLALIVVLVLVSIILCVGGVVTPNVERKQACIEAGYAGYVVFADKPFCARLENGELVTLPIDRIE